jgi:hypothetical protein
MDLEGRVSDVGLPDIFRLLRMSASTGALRITAGHHAGEVDFCKGQVYYATTTDTGVSIGGRLVRAALLREADLRAMLAEERTLQSRRPISSLLVEKRLATRELMEGFVREQIEDCTFSFFSWPNARFHFVPAEPPEAADMLVQLDAEGVIMEGCRRVDEWTLMMRSLGSTEKVPNLSAPLTMDTVHLSRQEWDVVCYLDGRRDINTVIAESGLDRFRTIKTVYDLVQAGLVVTRDPTLDLLGQKLAIAVRSPIDVYNVIFLNAVVTSDVTSHLRLETVEDEEVEVHITAGVREVEGEDGLLVYSVEPRTPPSVVSRMALETSGFIVLVNINSRDSVAASREDIAIMEAIKDRPYVVAIYASLMDEKISAEQVRSLLHLNDRVPILGCSLRDPEQTAAVVHALRELIP